MSSPTPDTPRIGNRYRLDERIGAGAMGAVWRGTDELLNRTVAVKELLAAALPSDEQLEESRQRILREGRIGARLQHAHVISMFDVVVHDDRPWLVMEYLPSRSLAAVLAEKGPIPPREAAAIGRQVADGLAAAHTAGVVHRDIKPGNVLIAEDGRAKITDFGVSRAVDDVQLTRTGVIAGTPAFLAPEVARGQEPTAASDIFALGAMLYASVEGEPPFGLDDNAYALLHKVATGAITPPREAGPLTALLMRLLANDPAERPSAAQARDALARIAAGQSVAGLATPSTASAVMDTGDAVAAPHGLAAQGGGTVVDAPAVPAPQVIPGPGGRGARRKGAPRSRDGRGRRTPVVLGALAVLLVVGGGVAFGIYSTNQQQGTPPVIAAPPTSGSPSPSATPTTTPAPTTSATPTPTPTTGTGQVQDPVSFVQNYYRMLPDDIDGAFAMLSPQAQAQSQGIQGFRSFYSTVRNVYAENLRNAGPNTVTATVVFMRNDGTTTRENYRFVVGTNSEGQEILQSFSTA
ncbi:MULTISPECIES: serine/threonine-protein kinase [unclassified Pseudonocardia]|uniref:serine/threonine-protein kinase n=1 Tax=unclassified Pseudonocardia TaxID=2619320 RepID=UPI00094B02C0|nr:MULTISPECIES: serine/threonine-protein kinase [unclassified Pseudonocardia]OLM33123.1 putative serine/threonine protein kinase [Pseudonocardia sp. Ae717_Ps2]